jgi:hypothetical protein
MAPSPNDMETVMDRKHVCTEGVISAYRDAAEVIEHVIEGLASLYGK